MKVYGLKTCETCRKALAALDAAGHAPEFVDVRAEPSVAGKIPGWIKAVGADTIVNRASMTWRKLSDTEKAKADDPAALAGLLDAHRTLIKRPLIEADGAVSVGWNKAVKSGFGVS
ncbi:ArsC/Spx/MgsR family protein [Glycocaulis sp.]